MSMRLVPNQNPERVGDLFEAFIKEIAPPEVEVSVERLHGGDGFVADVSHPAFNAAKRALQKGFGKKAVFIREGGSIPFVQTMVDTLKIPCLLIGFGLPNENAHAPNEWLDLEIINWVLSAQSIYMKNLHKTKLHVIFLFSVSSSPRYRQPLKLKNKIFPSFQIL